MDEVDVIPLARARVAERLQDAVRSATGLEPHPEVADALAALTHTLARLADDLSAAGRAEKIEP